MSRRDALPARFVGFCEPCKKNAYISRKDAKKVKHMVKHHGAQSVYPCPEGTGMWHLGHIPASVRQGTYSKDDYLDGLH